MANALRASDWYVETFKTWGVKTHGPRPTADQLAIAHYFGRPGKQSLALSMALREHGVTGSQMMFACDGHMQRNHISGDSGVIAAGYFKRVEPYQAGNGHTVYKLELTAKGTKRVEARKAAEQAADVAAAAEPKAKPKRTSKARKVSKAPSTDLLPVVEPVTDNKPKPHTHVAVDPDAMVIATVTLPPIDPDQITRGEPEHITPVPDNTL